MSVVGISNLPRIPLPPGSAGAVDRSADRPLEERQRGENSSSSAGISSSTDGAQQRRPATTRQQVLVAGQAPDSIAGRRSDEENLSYTARRALKAFAENAPSPGQQLGIELAGVDTYA